MAASKIYSSVLRYDRKAAASDIKYSPTGFSPETFGFVVYDNTFEELLGNSPRLTLIESRSDKFAHEAGVYIERNDRNYFTSNYQSGKTTEIYSIDSRAQDLQEHHFEDVKNPNGGCCYDGKILFCSQGDLTTPSALVLVDPLTSKPEVLLNNFHGRQFNSINDVVVHHQTNEIWFTDPTYGYEQAFRTSPQLPSQIYRFNPESGEVSCVADGFEQCNGLCFSPDYKKLYVTDTGAVQAHGTPGNGHNFSLNPRLPSAIYEYDVVDDGTRLAGRRMLAFCTEGVPDGIKCDTAGNIYSGCGDGVHVWNKRGSLIGKIYVGSVVANFNFARGGMWILAEERLFFAELGERGALAVVEGH